ncbi:LptF/LptG family permease [Aquibaculum sediminis]|uniref:LptF/LptG family permease n=1 Tax=Aquibaculum sediminis TaxID=3231907 RepID=UPI003452C358
MPIFNRYVIKLLLPPLGLTLLIALMVLLVERMLRVLDFVLGAKGPVRVVVELLAYLVPHYLGLALPMALFLAIYFAFRKLSRDSELDVMLATGTGLHQLLRPALAATLLLAMLAFVIFNSLQPHSRYAYRAVVYAVTNVSLQALLQPGVFVSADGFTFMVEGASRDKERYERVFVYRETDEDQALAITAQDGVLVETGSNHPPVVRLFDGVQLTTRLNPAENRDSPEASEGVLRFDELRTTIGDGAFTAFRARGMDERELTLAELWNRRDDPDVGIDRERLIGEFNMRLARIVSIPILPFLAIPLAMGRRRSARNYGVLIGVVVLLLFNELLQSGLREVRRGNIEPVVGIWLPVAGFALLSFTLFLRASFRVPGSGLLRRRRRRRPDSGEGAATG